MSYRHLNERRNPIVNLKNRTADSRSNSKNSKNSAAIIGQQRHQVDMVGKLRDALEETVSQN